MPETIKCSVCFPIVAKIFKVKFEGEKESKECVLRSWKECTQPATEHIEDFVDPNKETTRFVMHRCTQHVQEAKELHELLEKAKLQETK